MKNCLLIILVSSVFVLTACKKVEGEGGTSTISGKVYAQKYDAFDEIIEEYYIADERVYIIYGDDNNVYDDDFRTSFDGSFKFDFLTKGNYKIFVYEKCPSCPSGKQAVIKEVSITSNKSSIFLPDIIIRK